MKLTVWNNKWGIAIFPLGYKVIDAISGGDTGRLYLVVCDCILHLSFMLVAVIDQMPLKAQMFNF